MNRISNEKIDDNKNEYPDTFTPCAFQTYFSHGFVGSKYKPNGASEK